MLRNIHQTIKMQANESRAAREYTIRRRKSSLWPKLYHVDSTAAMAYGTATARKGL